MNFEMSLAAVSLRSALKYRRNWNKNGPAVKLLQNLMPQGGKKKGYRVYVEPGQQVKMRFTVPPAVRVAVQKAGFVITDYLAKKCVKADDKEQKNVFNIGKVIAKDQHAKAAFDNDPQLQNTKASNVQIVISCHPYDIIGMSTGRDWDKHSCMRLKDYRDGYTEGQYNRHLKTDVAEGTLVAYAVHQDDTNIQKPLCRCLLKPFVNEKGDVLYRRETSVYGNTVPGFSSALNGFLRKINAHVPEGFYEAVEGLYDDGAGTKHEHRVRNNEASVDRNEIAEDPALIVTYVKEKLAENKSDMAEEILSTISQYSKLIHAEDVDAIIELVKGSDAMLAEYANQIGMHQFNPTVADIGRRAGFLDAFADESRLKIYKDVPPSMHGRFAQGSLAILREYIVRLENEEEPDVARMRELIAGLMNGRYPLPTAETFADCPKIKSWVFTLASAARFMPLFGFTEYEKNVHDLLVALEGTEKTVDADTIEYSKSIGPYTVGLSLCILLDNDNNHTMDSDAVFSIPVAEAAPMICKRRPFKAFERLKNTHTKYFLDHIKLYVFQQCLSGTAMQDQYKDVKQQVTAYMTEEPDNFDTIQWDQWRFKTLALWNLPLIKFVQNNTPHFGKNMHNVVLTLLEELQKWEGEPINVDDNHFVEVLMRCAIATGRLLDPPVTIAHKVAIDDMDNDTFFDWYKTAKDGGMPLLGTMFGYMSYTMPGTPEINLQVMDVLPLLTEAATDVNNEDTLAFAHFTMPTVVRANRNIIRAIKELPLLSTAITQFENYCESLAVEETEEEDEAARELVDGAMTEHLDPEDDDYTDQYAMYFDDAKKIVEDRNYAKVDLNSKLVQIAQNILTQIGFDEDTYSTDMRGFFSNYDDDELEDNESSLEESGENIANHLTGLISQAEEEREKAGYGQ